MVIRETLRYMQMPYTEASEELKDQIQSLYNELSTKCSPKYICEKFEIEVLENKIIGASKILLFANNNLVE